MRYLSILLLLWGTCQVYAQTPKPPYTSSKFEQLEQLLPTPNNFRTADGSPGHEYWQQKADYKIKVRLDDEKQKLTGTETITYHNQSPNDLKYIWVQLDQNRFNNKSDSYKTMGFDLKQSYSMVSWMRGIHSKHGCNITAVKDSHGNKLTHTVNKTMMRIELPETLKAKGGKFTFSIDWNFFIIDAKKMGGRGGYEYFKEDDNYVYEISQWFPRMAVYDDVNGWQNKQFLGRGEFALTFGNYEVEITVPEDHIVAATGQLQNPQTVLTSAQRKKLEQAGNADAPVIIATQKEAVKREKTKAKGTKTWIFEAKDVRDFAWASSRKFIWDAQQVKVDGKKIWAMSYYPKEGNPLWERYSTNSIALTLKTYSKYTIPYPYPVALSIHGAVGGMEYPMISFNNLGRPDKNGVYQDKVRDRTIAVIIHEVGHNFFPMIINSDERQWTWMDEGLNSFMQYLTELEVPEQEWAKKDYPNGFPHRRGPAKNIVSYMKSDPTKLVPIMTNSEQIANFQFGNNAYGKPATALNVLRETVMGKELFDYAFKEYASRWAFKHPMPADFFRTMEDASAVDLDWFWRGWFYGTEACDISIEQVTQHQFSNSSKKIKESPFNLEEIDADKLKQLSKADQALFNKDMFLYTLEFKNKGGLIMPVIVQINYKDGTNEVVHIPAEIWRLDAEKVSKVLETTKEVASFILDPFMETTDIDTANNSFPQENTPSKFDKFKENKQ